MSIHDKIKGCMFVAEFDLSSTTGWPFFLIVEELEISDTKLMLDIAGEVSKKS